MGDDLFYLLLLYIETYVMVICEYIEVSNVILDYL